ncbi:MAG: HD domain-containing protein, partial [Prochlorococcaceae cyanobacterium]
MSSRTYHDPLHGAIRLERHDPAEALAIDLIETQPFQRLRRIRQLGPAFLTFHGAESSRFTHSLGVLHLARLALQQLERQAGALAEQRSLLYAAALLHDVGHGPLSHSGEEMYGLHHEAWSARLIREHSELHGLLEAHHSGLAEAVATLLEHGRSSHAAIAALVSSQLDCDRLDYLLRDSYSTGASYGQLDLQRILAALTLAPDGSLAVHPKGLMAVEHYLVVRNLMYRSVYNHRLNVV